MLEVKSVDLSRLLRGVSRKLSFWECVVHFLGGGKVEILNESTFKKLIFLLICPLLIVSSIGSAAAELYIGEQSQEAGISADNGVVSYTVDQDQSILSVPEQSTQDQSIQDQSAQELTENGVITQTQQGTVELLCYSWSSNHRCKI